MIDSDRIRELFDYCPLSGVVTWRVSRGTAKVGDVAGSVNGKGRLQIGIGGKQYLTHRLAWVYMTGEWPQDQIDHINGICTDNRWCNLREAVSAENNRNTKKRHDNKSGFKGVSWNKRTKKWAAAIRLNGKDYYLGLFHTPEAASASYEGAAALLFGQWKRITVTTTTFER